MADLSKSQNAAATTSVDEFCRARFETAWLSGARLNIEDCLPPTTATNYLATLEELVCVELELSWQAHSKTRYATRTGPLASTVNLSTPASVEDYSAEFPVLSQQESLQRLIQQEYLVRRRFCEPPSIEEYQQRFPQLDIGHVLSAEAIAEPGVAYQSEATSSPHDSAAEQLPSIPGYKLLERLGMGGMGIVYRARQLAADRIVAIKLLRNDRLNTLSPKEREDIVERLSVEAQATARLEHPHVVTLYEVNTDDTTQPWFSMQFVDGASLAEHLAKGPVSSQRAATLARQITDAIVCAHDAGVLHRDLKPQNVFLRNADQRVLVGDFGLAKLQLDDVQRTSHEDLLGTPAYMAPEQIHDASQVTVLADVWSIGATLYHLLTGRPPFQAATAIETLRQVLDLEPISPRKLNPAVDRDLETICLKCLQKNPPQRYLSARLLRNDLDAYLEHRPITARPVGAPGLLWRWCRRNPRPAVFAGLAVACVFAALLSLWIGYRTADKALQLSLASLTRERVALQDSDASHRLARQTVNDLFTEVSETMLLNKPGMQPLRRQLLQRTLEYYRKFAETGRHTPAMQAELGFVWYRIGRIESELGRIPDADHALDTALKIQEKLVAQQSESDELSQLASTWNARGALRMRQGQWNSARAQFEQALALRQQLAAEYPTEPEHQILSANTMMNLGAVDRRDGQPGAALRTFRQAATAYRSLLADASADTDATLRIQRELAKALFNSANAAADMGTDRLADECSKLPEAILLFETVLAAQPDNYSDRRSLAWCLQLQVECMSDLADATAAADAAMTQLRQLVSENPRVPELVVELSQIELLRGRLAADSGMTVDAIDCFLAGVARLHALPEASSPTRVRDIVVLDAELALARQLQGASGTVEIESALKAVEAQLAESAEDPELQMLQRQLRQAQQPSTL